MKKILSFLLNPLILITPLASLISCAHYPKKKRSHKLKENYGYDAIDDDESIIKEEYIDDSSVISEETSKKNTWHLKNSRDIYGVDIFYQSIDSQDIRNNKHKPCLSVFGYGKKKNEAGFKQLGRRIKNFLYHGPEIDSLSKITFLYMTGDSEMSIKGQYFSIERDIEIGINRFTWLDNDEEKITVKKELTPKREINSLMGTIVHEYGHHIMESYARIVENNVEYVDSTYETLYQVTWNKKFYNSFKKYLHYDKSSYDRYPGEFGKQDLTGHSSRIISTRYSLGGGPSAKELFDIANNHKKNWNPQNKIYNPFVTGLYDRHGVKIKGYKNLKTMSQITNPKNDIKYYYSLDELSTNKMSSLMYHSPFKINKAREYYEFPLIDPNRWMFFNAVNHIFVIVQRNYVIVKTPKGPRIYKDLSLHKKLLYMEDSAWGGSQVVVDKAGKVSFKEQVSTAEDLYKTYEQIMGFRIGKNSTNGSAINSIYYGAYRDDKRTELGKTLRISGFIPNEYKNNKNLKGIILDDKKYSFKKITSFLTHKKRMLGRSEKRSKDSYATIENIDLNKLNKSTQVFWWFDKNNDNILNNNEKVAMKAKNISKYQNLNTHVKDILEVGRVVHFVYRDKKLTYSEITTKGEKVYLKNGLK